MKLIDILKNDETKVINWFKSKEPAFVSAVQQSVKISGAILAWAKTPKAETIEQIVDAAIPKAQAWTEDAIKIATAMGKDMSAASTPASWGGIAVRLGAEILSIIDGGKLPSGIDGYIAEIQNIFVG